jgi:hypothetical protein
MLDYFYPFQVYCISFKLKSVYFKEAPTNVYKFEHMKYICVEINMSQSMKIFKYTSKLRLQVEFSNDFFCGQ